jgi:Uma2 family endonuclease
VETTKWIPPDNFYDSLEQLPTMYNLPSEDPEEPGLPDDFHYYQPQLFRETFRPPSYSRQQVYVATNLNSTMTLNIPTWYQRPD